MKRLLIAVLALIGAQILLPARAEAHTPPARYHLALGDSVPYGFTIAKALAGLPPERFIGYPELVSAGLGRVKTVNYACPGETTTSFTSGVCGWRATGHRLHDDYAGSQLSAAEAFLRAQPRGAQGVITLTLWGNDINDFLRSCPDSACIQTRAPGETAAFAGRLLTILSHLRAAAPTAQIVVVGAHYSQLTDTALGDQLMAALNQAMAQVSAVRNATLIDPRPLLNPADPALRRLAICTLTLLCREQDTHPSLAGHAALAALILRSLQH